MKELLVSCFRLPIVRVAFVLIVCVLLFRVVVGDSGPGNDFVPPQERPRNETGLGRKATRLAHDTLDTADKARTIADKVCDGAGCLVDSISALFRSSKPAKK